MTNLLVEGFATYGTGSVLASGGSESLVRLAMLSGAWADVRNSITSPPTTLGLLPFGTDTAVYYGGPAAENSPGNSGFETRRVIPEAADELIFSFRFAAGSLPTLAAVCGVCALRNAANDTVALLVLQPTGQLALFQKGTGLAGSNRVLLLQTQTPVIVAESPAHIEFKIKVSTGAFTLYVDGDNVMTGSGLTFGASGPVAMITMITADANSQQFNDNAPIYVTDLIIRNTTGDYNNTIMGDRRVATLMVNSDDLEHQGWTPHPLQRFGAAVLQNTDKGTSGLVYCAATTATDFGSGDFTVEGNFRFFTLPTGSNKAMFFGKWSEDTNQRSWRLYLGGPTLDSGVLAFQCSTDGSNGAVTTLFRWPWQPATGQWYHIAVSRVSGVLRVFIDGVQLGLDISDANTYYAGTSRTAIMAQMNNSGAVNNTRLTGWSDEFRLTKGTGRYTANFSPPVAAFPRNALGDPYWTNVTWLSGWENGIFDDSSFARTLIATAGSAQASPISVTPNDLGANYRVLNKRVPPLDYTFIEAALVPATGLFTLSGLPTDGETVTVGTKDGVAAAVYTFKTAIASAYDVLIGADADASVSNLVAAINKDAGEGTVYGTGTLANFDVVATKMPTPQLLATALIAGTAGNAIASTDTTANGSWGGSTLSGGANIPGYSQFGFQRPPNNTTVIDSITLVSRAWKTDSGPAAIQQSLVGPGGAADAGEVHNVSTSPTLYFDTFEVDPDTDAPLTPTTIVNGKVRINRTT